MTRQDKRKDYVLRQIAAFGPDIVSFVTEAHLLKAYLPDGTFRHVVGTLTEVLEALPVRSFLKIGPSIAINPKYVKDAQVRAYSSNQAALYVTLTNGTKYKCNSNYILQFAANTLIVAE